MLIPHKVKNKGKYISFHYLRGWKARKIRKVQEISPQITDLLGRIDDSMIYEYIKDLPLQVVEIQHVNSLATFNSLYEYFMFLYAIGSLQKIFNYKGEYEYALKLITVFKNLFSKEETLSVDFNYSYITLKKK